MIEFFDRGGIFMYPILVCSITALAIFLERCWSLRRSSVVPRQFVQEIESLVSKGDIVVATSRCRNNESSIASILLVGIENFGKTREVIKEYVEEVGRQKSAALERFVEALGTIPGVSTLLGLLGTISGMIKIFSVISSQTAVNPSSLAGGISEALITTFFGLSVAIPSLIMYKFLLSKINALVLEMESFSIRLVDLVKADERGAES